MPKNLFVDRAQGQAASAPNASATSITLTSSADTAEFTAAGSPSATAPLQCVLTDTADVTLATLIETVTVTNITTDTFTIVRDADGVIDNGGLGNDYSSGSCYITFVWSRFLAENMVQEDTPYAWSKGQSGVITTLTDGATITPNLGDSNNFTVTLGGNRTLANPTGVVAGQSGFIEVKQDATGSRTLALGTNYKTVGGAGITLSTAASAIDTLEYRARSSTEIDIAINKGWS